MLIQLVLALLLVHASDLALGGKRTNQREKQLGMSLDDSRVLNREDSCPPDCPVDCKDLLDKGHKTDGVYTIYISSGSNKTALVYCDMSGGGWTVFQRRSNGAVDFYRDWIDYDGGFGNLNSEHWLGFRKLNLILAHKDYRLRVDMADFNGRTAYAEYSDFNIRSPEDKYLLQLGEFEGGTAGDSMIYQTRGPWDLRGLMFSTWDQNNNRWDATCATDYHGAWWYNLCAASNLNGLYTTDVDRRLTNIFWLTWNAAYPLKSTSMKFRPM